MDKESRDNFIKSLADAINIGLESDNLKLQEYKRLLALAVLVMPDETLDAYQEQMIRYLASRNESAESPSSIPLEKLRNTRPDSLAKYKRKH
jgi:hypothetical protein